MKMSTNEPTMPLSPTPGVAMMPSYEQPVAEQPTAPEAAPAPAAPEAPAEPIAPEAPAEQPAPQAPAEPAPTAPAEPSPQGAVANEPAPAPAEPAKQQSFEEYIDSLVKDIPAVELPKTSDVAPDDPKALEAFFEDFANKVVQRAQAESQRNEAIRNSETKLWDEALIAYPELKDNRELRDMVHNIRVGAFSRGQSLTPKDVAAKLIDSMSAQYKKGVNDTNVQTRVQDSQPLGGAGTPPTEVSVNYEALQTGGRDEAVNQIEALMRAGKI